MKRLIRYTSLLLFFILFFPVEAYARELIPVGTVIGLELRDNTVTVASFDENLSGNAKASGIETGDRILAINGKNIRCAEDVRYALNRSKGTVNITVERSGKTMQLQVTPQITANGPKLGLYLRQGITGIGTVTWYDPETHTFGTLGHGVNNGKNELLRLAKGYAYNAEVVSVRKGKVGEPGQLVGAITSKTPIGTLQANTARGVFGIREGDWSGQAIPVGTSEEVHTGSAVIRSTISGSEVREYSVEILKIYPKSRENGRNLLLRVTDPALLSTTGGIVQGMSGSPIIQDGKLVGAVTHVCVN